MVPRAFSFRLFRNFASLLPALFGALLLIVFWPTLSGAFGDDGAFNPRMLLPGNAKWEGVRTTAPARWAFELTRRTSAPARLRPTTVRPDDASLLAEPFTIWGGDADIPPLTTREVKGLRRFLALGGILLVDDFAPETQAFTRAAKRELARVITDRSPVTIGPENVLFRSFYYLKRPIGRIEGPSKIDAYVLGGNPQIIFSAHDLLGALARSSNDTYAVQVTPGTDPLQREKANRMAINISMYVLCSNYKDDQVHAPFLMRRRSSEPQ
ncbi:MAG: DUF4159 domain-containing protein [Polyangiaceae bacterium]|nr:DUF4159 domain-containing protein [Polyangiaceae bacterium]